MTANTRNSRKRSAEHVYKTPRLPKQVRFTPHSHNAHPMPLQRSTPRTIQQTLTQIDFVKRYTPEDADDVDLDYIAQSPSPPSKRRRIPPHGTPDCDSRKAVKKNKVPEKVLVSCKDDNSHVNASGRAVSGDGVVTRDIKSTSPRTPKKTIKTEIPSSQSPVDTPLSALSRRSLRSVSRSPLKEKSANARRTQVFAPRQKLQPPMPKLEILDTYDQEKENSNISTEVLQSDSSSVNLSLPAHNEWPFVERTSTQLVKPTSRSRQEEEGWEPDFKVERLEENDIDSQASCDQSMHVKRRAIPEFTPGHVEVEDLRDDPSQKYLPGNETQAAFTHISCGLDDLMEEDDICIVRGSERGGAWTVEKAPAPLSSSSKDDANLQQDDSEAASAQLTNDLRHFTRLQTQPAMETESQIDDQWQPYYPEDLDCEPLPHDYMVEHQRDEQKQEQEPTLPNLSSSSTLSPPEPQPQPQPQPLPSLPLPLPHPLPIPSSQATTVDITQQPASAPASTPTPSSTPNKITSRSPPPDAISSSPIIDSNGLGCGGAGASANWNHDNGYIWDGNPLTESQLLPESIFGSESLGEAPPVDCWD
ncbi:hypothetical protein MMC09_003272 [Bachmanniomyces sp. S44760]|nr:hypothetical protein [Bachmanniomyces sp. S44760]